ncbi:MAG: hypothetical protein M1358_17310 [Chloroflexi bacterium]|nr:hypothetical protein [Chloroflexota bacterium]
MRNEIWCEATGILKGKETTPANILELVTRIDYVLDIVLAATIEIFEEKKAPGEATSSSSEDVKPVAG